MLGTRPDERYRRASNTTLDHIVPVVGISLTAIVSGEQIVGQPPHTVHIPLTEDEVVEYEAYAYYQDRLADCWLEVRRNDRRRKCS